MRSTAPSIFLLAALTAAAPSRGAGEPSAQASGDPVAPAVVATAVAPTTAVDPAVGTALLAALDSSRVELGLPALSAPPALTTAAQAHAEAMAGEGWFGFTSPAGVSVEQRVDAAGHEAGLVAAKVFRAPATETPEQLAKRWWGAGGDASRNSLFHSQVTEVGLGVARRGDETFYAFVLVRPPAPPPAVTEAAVETARADFLAAVNQARAARGLPELRRDPALERAAQRHAEEVLPVLRAGQPLDTVEDLATRVEEELHLGTPQLTGGSTLWQQRGGNMRTGSRLRGGTVGRTLVVDARNAAEAVSTVAEQAQTADVFESRYGLVGIGVVLERTGGPPDAVWVACLTRN
jgi:uncharacterized protein YkwD